MLEAFALYLRLVILILTKLLHQLAACFYSLPELSVRRAINAAGMGLSTMRRLIFGSNSRSNQTVKLGIAILSRYPIAERATIGGTGVLDNFQASLKIATLFERIMGETMASVVVQWLGELSSRLSSTAILFKTKLFLVYRMNYTSAFSLSGWLSILPHHSKPKSTTVVKPVEPQDDVSDVKRDRCSQILSQARYNLNNRTKWEDPDVYCSSRKLFAKSDQGYCRLSSFHWTKADGSEKESVNDLARNTSVPIEYVTVKGLEFSALLEVALRAALRSSCDYILVLNPRVIGLQPHHLSVALQLLTGISDRPNDVPLSASVDVVFGLTKPSLRGSQPNSSVSSPGLVCNTVSGSPSTHPTGLYLLGLSAGRGLMLGADQLTNSVEWASSTTATRLWSNLSRWFPDWNVAFMRDRLEEISQPTDLLVLEQQLGVKTEHLLEDSITVIIPMGPGHEDDAIDLEEDMELVDLHNSKALAVTLELAVCNASGKRPVEIIIVSSESSSLMGSHISETASVPDLTSPNTQFGLPPFRFTRLRPMIKVSVHHYNGLARGPSLFTSNSDATGSSSDTSPIPRRGELIRYAVEHLAKGSMLVFVEPGIQLPINWDSAVYHSLQRPGVGMGCFAYRLHLHDKYIHRKSFTWAVNCWLANHVVNVQTRRTEIPIVGQPHFIYAHYLACLGGYPTSSRMLHPIDLALSCHRHIGRVVVTRTATASAGVPANFALRHGAYRTAVYTALLGLARVVGATEPELRRILSSDWHASDTNRREFLRPRRLPLVQPHYLDGY